MNTEAIIRCKARNSALIPPWRRCLNRLLDLIGASVCLVLVAPLFVLIAFLIRFDLRSTILTRENRIGANRRRRERRGVVLENMTDHRWRERRRFDLGGRPLTLILFRTKLPQPTRSKSEYELNLIKEYEPGSTHLGRWLRRTGLEKLPLLLNVLKGDLSLLSFLPRQSIPVWQPLPRAPVTVNRFMNRPDLVGVIKKSGRADILLTPVEGSARELQ